MVIRVNLVHVYIDKQIEKQISGKQKALGKWEKIQSLELFFEVELLKGWFTKMKILSLFTRPRVCVCVCVCVCVQVYITYITYITCGDQM